MEAKMLPLIFFSSSLLSILVFMAAGEGKYRVLNLQKLDFRQKSTSQSCLPQRSRGEKGATVLEVKHHTYCSMPFTTREEELLQILYADETRFSSLNSRIKRLISRNQQAVSSKVQIPLTSGAKLQTLNYVVSIKLGGNEVTVIVDTGSDLTWVQCQPCSSCYDQEDPLFNPSSSPSYQEIPCNSPTCSSLQIAAGISSFCGNNQPSCNYSYNYDDGSYTRGILGWEQIDLAGTIIDGFVFGCGESNHGLFGGTSGLMGLGRTQLSLISQTIPQFGGVFSYCLPPRNYDSSGSLILGDNTLIFKNNTPLGYTRMILDPPEAPFYFVNLTGISIGSVALQASGYSSKLLIDSGTVITRLAPSMHETLRDEFMRQFSGYPTAPGFSILDICFNLAGYGEVRIPTLKFVFDGGVELEVDVNGIFYFVKPDASQVCLALASLSEEEEVSILGNYQQKNLRVVYDTLGSRMGFAEEACSWL
ncbi:Aspartic proteinase nepenthesin-1 [Apostasia shenzhenica]|uniref:Aspartic proteinase nepenthesin-1 n=1 Tax=Apostasia shenzhenica TaxID=1088818 RepID=A0A2I0A0X8_9ASPA|nr:Aspartic proteinase nepenthesin-1 [Apostasia shenzhenica]